MIKKILLAVIILTNQACQPASTEIVQQGRIDITVSASGELESSTTTLISPPAVANIWNHQIKYLIDENTPVEAGTLLVSFDDKEVSKKLVQQQAELKQAKQELANMIIQGTATEKKLLLAVAEMKMNFDKARRSADIVDQGLSENDKRKVSIDFNIAKNDLFLAREKIKFHQRNQPVNLRLAQGKVDRALIKVASLKQDIEKLNIKAPIDGIVVYRSNWSGEKPAVGESVSFGRPILEVAVLDKMQLTAEIAEVDSGKLRIGQSVEIKLDGVQGQVFQGKLISTGSVFREKSRQDKRRICDAIIEFNQTNGDIMRPGMTARIDIVTETINDAVTVSSAAVRQADGRSTVTIAGMFYQTQKDIEITHIVDGKAVVSNGLIPGEKVLL